MQNNTVANFITSLLPAHKVTPSGWHTIDAPCCVHRGESQDNRKRGGFHFNPNGSVSFHCFNCNYKASYVVGRHITVRFRKLLHWLNVSDAQIQRLVVEALRLKHLYSNYVDVSDTEYVEPEFAPKELPNGALPIDSMIELCLHNDVPLPQQLTDAVDLLLARKVDIQRYNIHWTPETEYNYCNRVIVPLYWKETIVGYTARAIYPDIKPKYYAETDSGYVYNINNQHADSEFVIVTEGIFDAMSLDAVALAGNECNESKANIIESLQKTVIVVPDFDKKYNKNIKRYVWSGEQLVDAAIEYGWNVSFPQWSETCKDVNDAVVKYGKLFTLKTIINATEHNKLKIELYKKRYN